MSAPVISELTRLEATFERAERLREEAAEAERAAYLHWQEAYGAYELARDEASTALRAWVQAVVP
ncbi:MAG: hypothetical protein JO281_07135 [Pseudonocardiales bacterium]|nr:hypothetical protein [Pseudonocardiales bacterium]